MEIRKTKKNTRLQRLVMGTLAGLLLLSGCGRQELRRESEPMPTTAPEAEETPLPVMAAEEAPSADDPTAWNLRLVRNDMPLEPGFAPELEEIERKEMFDRRAVSALRVLIAEARADGYAVYVCSGYRAYDVQYKIYWNHVRDYQEQGLTLGEAEEKTRLAVNYPGASEHQLGLAADLLEYQNQPMEPWIGGSGLMLWLEEHCADYGFIIRYPADKTEITGVEYEPWHLRYVGPAAEYIMENGLCLEEYVAMLEAGGPSA